MKYCLLALVSLAPTLSWSFAPSSPTLVRRTETSLSAQKWDLFEDRTVSKNVNTDIFERVGKIAASSLLAVTLSFSAFTAPFPNGEVISTVPSAQAADGAAIGLCLLKKCRLPLAKCITNPNCLANVICINTCNGKEDEEGCQVECGNTFENDVVGEFNKCAVSDMSCVPQKQDDGSYPVPANDVLVQKFDTKLWNGRWYITAGQNKLFDIFDCQVHFFTETEPGKFFGKLNWRIEEPDGEFFTRDAIQEFYQDPKQPAHLINHDNDYLHYQDDWYIIDYAEDDNKEGVPPFAFVYYRGENDAWVGYGGVVVYTRDSKLPESLLPRLREAAKKVNFDFDKDFELTDNTCKTMEKGEEIVLREKFAGKMAIQTEKQLQQQAVLARTAASNAVSTEINVAEKAIVDFEKEIAKDVLSVEKEIVKDVVNLEKEVVKDVVNIEKEVVKDVVKIEKAIEAEEKEIVDDIVKEEQTLLKLFKR
mmetsp:Transcript_16331/g.23147  ORF Transcript_16331/g.23147 Transcript_16331/m.23147 type:complete len:477 (-) Transcript_16331:86-1516(-)|eukprot:CAMPEP_0201695330 /NCGR_PEP_ID=MMETSP0578-20130828/7329_1 /ASSEMBLY_ACC=CAM_ASM_000663 /TAXON_ID=267565 /ORGANISM="Skeletonema grethea, Strain CCMP 1804" /LENGTH=476 /DNA_ID=CAMNT_0048181173 /DNA_START=14 /DNA_END=1444 /DNA_ORIENTATION=-